MLESKGRIFGLLANYGIPSKLDPSSDVRLIDADVVPVIPIRVER